MARQGDFIPISGESSRLKKATAASSSSRVVREDDENDMSDEENTISNSTRLSLNYRETMHKEKQQTRDNFLAYEQGKRLLLLIFLLSLLLAQ
jgi:hypothetical protein